MKSPENKEGEQSLAYAFVAIGIKKDGDNVYLKKLIISQKQAVIFYQDRKPEVIEASEYYKNQHHLSETRDFNAAVYFDQDGTLILSLADEPKIWYTSEVSEGDKYEELNDERTNTMYALIFGESIEALIAKMSQIAPASTDNAEWIYTPPDLFFNRP